MARTVTTPLVVFVALCRMLLPMVSQCGATSTMTAIGVTPDGNDTTCTPCRTLTSALLRAGAAPAVITVAPGVYTEMASVVPAGGNISIECSMSGDRGSSSTCSVACAAGVGPWLLVSTYATLSLRGLRVASCSGNPALGTAGALVLAPQGSAVASVSITNCSFVGCRGVSGGAVAASGAGALLHMSGVTFTSNGATADGGAVAVSGGAKAVLQNCTLVRNAAALNGGALACTGGGDIRIAGSRLDANAAGMDGGALRVKNCTSGLTQSVLSRNTAGGMGGGLACAVASTLDMHGDNAVWGNGAARGGGLYAGGMCSVTASVGSGSTRIEGNGATQGGGVFATDVGTVVALNGSSVIAGGAANQGGGGYIQSGAALLISNGTFIANAAAAFGGDIYLTDTGTTSVLHNCSSRGSRAEEGGFGFVTMAANLLFQGGTVSSASASFLGGALKCDGDAQVALVDATLAFCSTGGQGGAIFVSGATVVGLRSRFLNNSATAAGGAAYLQESGTIFNATACHLEANYCLGSGSSGGAVCVVSGAYASVSGSAFVLNSGISGGAVAVIGAPSSAHAMGSTFSDNVAYDSGGAVSCASGGSFEATGCSFAANYGFMYGGSVVITGLGSRGAISGSLFQSSSASNRGGAVAAVYSATLVVNSSVLTGSASENVGGHVTCEVSATFIAFNCSIELGVAIAGGALFLASGCTASVTSCSVSSNFAVDEGGAAHVEGPTTLVILRSTSFRNNSAVNQAGAVSVIGGTVNMVSVSVSDSSAGVVAGGLLCAGGGSSGSSIKISLSHTAWTNCSSAHAGAIYLAGCVVHSDGASFLDNAASSVAGAVMVDSGAQFFSNSTVALRNNGGTAGGWAVVMGDAATLFVGSRSVLSFNKAEYGGAIACLVFGSVTTVAAVDGSVVASNGGTFGAGIYAEGFCNLRIYNSRVMGNAASDTGGGIHATVDTSSDATNAQVSVSLRNSLISGNSAAVSAGGMFMFTGQLSLVNTSITDNSAPCTGAGFVCKGDAHILVDDASASTGNHANQGHVDILCKSVNGACVTLGSALWAQECAAPVILHIATTGDSTATCCGSPSLPCAFSPEIFAAGDVFVLSNGTYVLSAVIPVSASLLLQGSGGATLVCATMEPCMAVTSTAVVSIARVALMGGDSSMIVCSGNSAVSLANVTMVVGAVRGTAANGSALVALSCDVSAASSTFVGLSSYTPGAAISATSSTLTLTACTFVNCTSSFGGAVFCSSCAAVMTDVRFVGCAASVRGGSICAVENSVLVAQSVSSSRGSASEGGDIACDSSVVTLTDALLEGATASGSGGSVFSVLSTVTLNRCLLRASAATVYGGAVAATSSVLALTHTSIMGARAGANGGGVWAGTANSPRVLGGYPPGSLVMESSSVRDCTAVDGAGVYLELSASGSVWNALHAVNVSFVNNQASSRGGGMCLLGAPALLEGCNVLGNRAAWGGGLYGAASMTGTQWVDNVASVSGGAVFMLVDPVPQQQLGMPHVVALNSTFSRNCAPLGRTAFLNTWPSNATCGGAPALCPGSVLAAQRLVGGVQFTSCTFGGGTSNECGGSTAASFGELVATPVLPLGLASCRFAPYTLAQRDAVLGAAVRLKVTRSWRVTIEGAVVLDMELCVVDAGGSRTVLPSSGVYVSLQVSGGATLTGAADILFRSPCTNVSDVSLVARPPSVQDLAIYLRPSGGIGAWSSSVVVPPCALGTVQPVGSTSCIPCHSGSFSWIAGERESADCHPCMTGGACDGGAVVNVSAGWWRWTNASLVMFPCSPPGACPGGGDTHGLCAPGYSGALCMQCDVGYSRGSSSTAECTPCGSASAVVGSFVAVILMLSTVIAFASVSAMRTSIDGSSTTRTIVTRIVIGHLQVLNAFSFVRAPWPASSAGVFAAASVAVVPTDVVFSSSCFGEVLAGGGSIGFFHAQVIVVLVPFVVIAFLFSVAGCVALLDKVDALRRCAARCTCSAAGRHHAPGSGGPAQPHDVPSSSPRHSRRASDWHRVLLTMAVVLIVTVQPWMAREAARIVNCVDVVDSVLDPDSGPVMSSIDVLHSVLAADMSIVCGGAFYVQWAGALGTVTFIMFVVGPPVVLLWFLRRSAAAAAAAAAASAAATAAAASAAEGVDDDGTTVTAGGASSPSRGALVFLMAGYAPRVYWWECFAMVRKTTLYMLIIFLASARITQTALALLMLVILPIIVHAYVRPFAVGELQHLEMLALMTQAVTLSAGQIMVANDGGEGAVSSSVVSGVAVFANALFCGAAGVAAYRATGDIRDRAVGAVERMKESVTLVSRANQLKTLAVRDTGRGGAWTRNPMVVPGGTKDPGTDDDPA